jgi:hypothetical protein
LGPRQHDRKRERKDRRTRGKKKTEKEREDFEEIESTPVYGDAEGLTVEELTYLPAEGVQE